MRSRPCRWWRLSPLMLGGCACLALAASSRVLRLNISPSVPLGLYYLSAVPTPLASGTLVLLPVPLSVQAWHSRWLPLLKPVAAIAGEEVCNLWGVLFVRGEWYGPIYTEVAGQRLPQLEGCQVVPDGSVFLASPTPKSLDSRYFNSIPIHTLSAEAIPLWVWRR